MPLPSYPTIPRNICLNILFPKLQAEMNAVFPVPSQLPKGGKKTSCFVSEIKCPHVVRLVFESKKKKKD